MLRTDGEVAQFVVKQELALMDCEARRKGLVEIVEGANKAMKPKKRLFSLRF